jgi:uncharacterized protein (DUF305 family)
MRLRNLGVALLSVLLTVMLAACGTPATETSTAPTTDIASMSSTAEGSEEMDHDMDHGVIPAEGQPYDAVFVDSMIVHHEGAILMANQALEQAERQEVKDLANAILTAQEAEIGQMKEWRTAWYPDLAETSGMAMDMGPMEVPAGNTPFDQRFIQAMIPHHESAITMAQDALQQAERQEIKDLAQEIISAQEAEIAQMKTWLKDWYGVEQ